MTITFEILQDRLLKVLGEAEVKVGSKQGKLLECVYVQALRDSGIKIPSVVDMWLMSGRSVAGYKPSTKTKYDIGKRVQLGYDHGEDVEELEETN
jgi:hypothetical protein